MEVDDGVSDIERGLSSLIGANMVRAEVSDNSSCPRLALYKNNSYSIDQERRWLRELDCSRRHKKRTEKFDENRAIAEAKPKKKNPWSSGGNKKRPFKNFDDRSIHLMLAEWFLFMPPNFATDYLFKLCPKGRHVFVIAEKGQTNIYSRGGLCLATVLTRLPGGGLGQSSSQMHRYQTMLDCIMIGVPSASMTHKPELDNKSDFCEDHASPASTSDILTLKVLDLVKFRSTSYAYQKFLERSQWLEGFHRDQIESLEPGDVVKFEIIPAIQCAPEIMNQVFSISPPSELDGVLFYHSYVGYRRGATPLVGWLKPYMLPEWFPELNVHVDYLADMPPDYENYLADIKLYEEQTKMHCLKAKGNVKQEKITGDLEMCQD